MCEQVTCHERAVTVSAYTYSCTVPNTHFRDFTNGCFGAPGKLFNKIVIGLLVALAYDWKVGIIHYGETLGCKKYRRAAADSGKCILASTYLRCIRSTFKLAWICPHKYRQRSISFNIVAFRKVKICGKIYPVLPFVSDLLFYNASQAWLRIGKICEGF